MANNNEAKVKFLADTTEFRDGVNAASSTLSELNSSLKLNAAQMKTNGESVDALTDRQQLLEQQLEAAKDKTRNLAAQMEACTRYYGENSAEAQKLSTQINNARTAEERIQQEINRVNQRLAEQTAEANKTETALEKMENTISEQESALEKLKKEYASVALEFGTNSREARELAGKISSLSSELNENRGKLQQVEQAASDLEGEVRDAGDAARDASDGFTVWKGTLANLASTGISTALNGIKDLAAGLWNLGDETREYRAEMGKLDAAFAASKHSSETATATYEKLYGVIGETDQSVEAAQQIALLSNNTEDCAQWAELASGVVGRFGDALQPETFFEAANETLKLGEATGAYTQMLEGTGMSVEKFNEGLAACKTESEKQAYMLKISNQALGSAGEAYRKNNASIIEANQAQEEYNQGLAGLGQTIEPIKTVFMQGMASMLQSASDFIAGLDMEKVKASIKGAFDYLQNTVFPAIKAGITWFIDNKDLIIAGIAGIVAGIAAFKIISIVQTAVGIFKAFQAATVGLTAAQKLLNLVMMANPIGLVVAAIAGLVTAFVLLWNNCEAFREFWKGLWEGIKNVAAAVWEAIKAIFSGAWEIIKGIWNGAGSFFSGVWNGIKNVFSTVGGWFSNIFTSAWNGVKSAWSGTKTFFSGVWDGIKGVFSGIGGWFKTKFTEAWEAAKNAWSGAKNFFANTRDGIQNVWSKFDGWMGSKFGAAWEAVKKIWSVPVGYFKQVWESIKGIFSVVKNVLTGNWRDAWNGIKGIVGGWKSYFSGIWNGIKSVFGNVGSWFKNTFSNAWTAVKNVFSGWGNFFGGLWNTIKNKFSTIGTNIGNAISSSVKSGINGVLSMIERVINSGINLINGAIGLINKIPGVNIGKIRTLSLPRLASGGVLSEETAFIGGEYAGARTNPEIVTPQSIMRETFEDALNAQFENRFNLDRLAIAIEELASRPIRIAVGDRDFAEATAGASDSVSGNRLTLRNRGLALS